MGFPHLKVLFGRPTVERFVSRPRGNGKTKRLELHSFFVEKFQIARTLCNKMRMRLFSKGTFNFFCSKTNGHITLQWGSYSCTVLSRSTQMINGADCDKKSANVLLSPNKSGQRSPFLNHSLPDIVEHFGICKTHKILRSIVTYTPSFHRERKSWFLHFSFLL